MTTIRLYDFYARELTEWPEGYRDQVGPRLTGMCPACNLVHETNPYDDDDPEPGVPTYICIGCKRVTPWSGEAVPCLKYLSMESTLCCPRPSPAMERWRQGPTNVLSQRRQMRDAAASSALA